MADHIKYAKAVKGERSIAPFIPQSSHITPDTIITRNGDLQRTWRVNGVSFETVAGEDAAVRKEQLNTLIRSIGSSQVAIWQHTCNGFVADRLEADFESPYCQDYNQRYFDAMDGEQLMTTDLYLTVIYRPVTSRIGRQIMKAGRRSIDEILKQREQALRKLDDIGSQVESSLRRYGLTKLTAYHDENGVLCSPALSFLNYLVCGEWQKVQVPPGPLNEYLGSGWMHIGTETISIRTPQRIRYAQALDFKDYNHYSEPGLLAGLLYEQYEFVITQSFSLYSRRDGISELHRQRSHLLNTEDASASQIADIDVALDQLVAGVFAMGEYHFSMVIYGETPEQASENTSSASTILSEAGFITALAATATDATWYAQLPCNWHLRPRLAKLTSLNYASLACMFNFPRGKRDGNPWGQAVTLFRTPSNQPIYFNFHASGNDDDQFDKKLLGNTRLIGKSGVGKTVLLNHFFMQSQKFAKDARFNTVFFDYKQGARLCILATGGQYLTIKNGKPTGFNPFQMDPTESNVQFLQRLVKKLAMEDGERLMASDETRIAKAVKTVMGMDRPLRSMTTLLQNIPEGTDKTERQNSVPKRLAKWCRDDGNGNRGALWWVLDNDDDLIDFTTHTNYGFDGTDFLDNEQVRTPITMYLIHRMKAMIDGRRFMYLMDEAFKYIDDDAFRKFAGDEQPTIRSKNGLGVFATQMPKTVLNSAISAELIEQMATEIYLPNPRATHDDYVKGFGLTETEFEVIKHLDEESHRFLIKQDNRSVVAWLDLDGFDDDLAILSGTSESVALLDEILRDVGDDPADWMPEFHRRRKVRTVKRAEVIAA